MAMSMDGEAGAATPYFTVLTYSQGQRLGMWSEFVGDVGRVLDLQPSYLPGPVVGREWIGQVLDRAARLRGPVLVLPGAAATGVEGLPSPGPPRLHRAMIASDDSPEAVHGARLCTLHLLRSGVQTKVLHVLTEQTAPPMWEGAGHHVEAWRAELERRYGLADSFEVCSGSPGPAVRARAARSDLVVLLWHRAPAAGRAKVVRAVLDDGIHQPCLLVPVHWVAQMHQRMRAAPSRAG